jgi:Reverse transcriptase (RNA-dependent DNA polymerase)/RNase H-like domain found in reverse transcriptase/Integrase zinc binding domain/Chromo (CHRromatin Organisation MOdifier) domain/Integrase core domain/Retroviral aspartyl protease
VILIQLTAGSNAILTEAMIDSGASTNFIDTDFAKENQLPMRTKARPFKLEVVDGRPISSGLVTHESPCKMTVRSHEEELTPSCTKLGHYPVILGIPWLKTHDPTICWSKHNLGFDSSHCHANCLKEPKAQRKPKTPRTVKMRNPKKIAPKVAFQSTAPKVAMINNHAFKRALRGKAIMYQVRLTPETNGLETKELSSTATTEASELALIPKEYHEFADVFSKGKAEELPTHAPYDHSIPLQGGTTPPFGPMYRLSETELNVLKEYIEENLTKGFIRASTSPAAAPILFVKKKDGSLRLCVDYRGLNKITIKNRYPLPLISELFDRIGNAQYFTKIDLRDAYHRLRMAAGQEWKTAFRCRYGHFEYCVMPFGLTNAPASFQSLMNHTLHDMLDKTCVAFLDDILIYSNTLEEHKKHVKQVLRCLRKAKLFAKPQKCVFHTQEVEFLGFIISPKGLKMDPAKTESIRSWPSPKSVHDIQVFLGFANFYRRFIKRYSRITTPITRLLKKGVKFHWSKEAQLAFEKLKRAFASAPILRHFDSAKPSILETDASDYALGCVISQRDQDGRLHPVAFHSRKFSPPELNYGIPDKEMLAVITAFKEWRPWLEGARHPATVLTDHKNLAWFTEAREYNRRQARWAEYLAGFDFMIVYRPGKKGGKPDALSRRPDYQIGHKGGEKGKTEKQEFLKPHQFTVSEALVSYPMGIDEDLKREIAQNLTTDENIGMYLQYLKDPDLPRSKKVDEALEHYHMEQDIVFCNNRIYVPNNDALRLQLCRQTHDCPTAGHYGRKKTLDLLTRDYSWPGMSNMVREYVRTCETCSRNKTPRHRPYGPLHPLPIPKGPWTSVSMDFIVELPNSKGHDAVIVFVDRMTKMAHFIATTTKATAKDLADLFFQYVFSRHGLPEDVISDRGPQFTSRFWKRLLKLCGIERNLSTAFHPQSDGQTERVNQVLEQYLRIYCNYQQDDWTALLPLAEFTYNNTQHSSTETSPFYANYGYHPRHQMSILRTKINPAAESYTERIHAVQKDLQINLQKAQETQKKYYDKYIQQGPGFTVGDKAWLIRKNIKTTRPSRKLDYRRFGPYRIVEIVGHSKQAYKLDLPATMQIHPVFHVSLLEPYNKNTIPGRTQAPPPAIEIENSEEWEVQEILDSKRMRGKLFYLVDWKGWSPQDRSWEPAVNVENCRDLIADFHTGYPLKPH